MYHILSATNRIGSTKSVLICLPSLLLRQDSTLVNIRRTWNTTRTNTVSKFAIRNNRYWSIGWSDRNCQTVWMISFLRLLIFSFLLKVSKFRRSNQKLKINNLMWSACHKKSYLMNLEVRNLKSAVSALFGCLSFACFEKKREKVSWIFQNLSIRHITNSFSYDMLTT